MYFAAETEINASPEKIWAILTDAAKYPEWDVQMIRLDGKVALGETITANTKLSDRAFPVKVTEFVPNETMTWIGGMPFGLFTGVRIFKLERKGSSTLFKLREDYSGLLLGLMKGTLPDLNRVFAEFAANLKKRAES